MGSTNSPSRGKSTPTDNKGTAKTPVTGKNGTVKPQGSTNSPSRGK